MPFKLNKHSRGFRRFALMYIALLLAVAVVFTHGVMNGDHMGHDSVTAVCLAVLVIVGGLLAAGNDLAPVVSQRAPRMTRIAVAAQIVRWPRPVSRDGPSLLQVFRI